MPGYGSFAAHYDGLTNDVSYPDRAAYFHQLISQNSTGAKLLLDLACGTGSLSVEFSKLGYDVIGVDGSPDMLSVAMQKAAQLERELLFLCQDMTHLDLYGTIDVAVCALDSLNHLTSRQALGRAIERVSLFLNPGGLFLFDVNTPYKHREVLGDNAFVFENDQVFCVWQNSYHPDTQVVDIVLDFFTRQGKHYIRQSEAFRERAYDHQTICGLLEDAGLDLVVCYEGDTFQPPCETTQRAVYLARKQV